MASVGRDPRTGNVVIRVYAGTDPLTHRPHTVSRTLPADATEGEIAVATDRLEARAAVTKRDPHAMTVGSAVSYYLQILPTLGMSPTTIMAYRSYATRHVNPRIGGVRFEAAGAHVFSAFLRVLQAPEKKGGAGLAKSTVVKICAFLKGCFRQLKADGVIDSNPMAEVRVGRAPIAEGKPMYSEDYRKLVAWLRSVLSATVTTDGDFERLALATIVWTDLHTGLRRGELSGLCDRHWTHAGGEACLRVEEVLKEAAEDGRPGLSRGTPKSRRSAAPIGIDAETDRVISAWVAVRDAVLAETGAVPTRDSPLFCHADGRPWRPRDITDAFRSLKVELGLDPGAHLHQLRHTHASYLIANGANLKDVQDRLRHASVSTTGDVYGHLMPGRDHELAEMAAQATRELAGVDEEEAATYVPTCPKDGRPCARFEIKEES